MYLLYSHVTSRHFCFHSALHLFEHLLHIIKKIHKRCVEVKWMNILTLYVICRVFVEIKRPTIIKFIQTIQMNDKSSSLLHHCRNTHERQTQQLNKNSDKIMLFNLSRFVNNNQKSRSHCILLRYIECNFLFFFELISDRCWLIEAGIS